MSAAPPVSFPAPDAPRAGLARLGRLAVLQVEGADSLDFLHSQLTQDVKHLAAAEARLAGYCTAKGRLLATLVFWRDGDSGVRLMADAGVAPALQKRLSMFVLRAKAKLAPAALEVHGVQAGAAARAALQAAVGELPGQPWQRADLASGTWIAAPAPAGLHRWWWIAPAESAAAAREALAGTVDAMAETDWEAGDIRLGLPWIRAATQDLVIPQTVNLERIGGVSFTKGCYPGQEIVARSHYLGKIKRRMFPGLAAQAPADVGAWPGMDIFAAGAEQPCGRVIDAARDGSGAVLLVESTLAAAEAGPLAVGAPDGPALALLPLPYALDDHA